MWFKLDTCKSYQVYVLIKYIYFYTRNQSVSIQGHNCTLYILVEVEDPAWLLKVLHNTIYILGQNMYSFTLIVNKKKQNITVKYI